MFQNFQVELPNIGWKEYNILNYGAVAGGIISNTKAFAAAVQAASQDSGRVVVPDGIWLTGPIGLKSGVELHLSDNAVIVFDKNSEEYPLIETDFEGIKRIRTISPIYADGAEDVAITGKGVIDGSGHLWRPVKHFKVTERQWKTLLETSPYVFENKEGGMWVPTETIYEGRNYGEIFPDREGALKEAAPYYDFYRPVMVSFKHCRRVLIEDVLLQNSPAWCVHPYFCENFTMRGVKINNPYHAQNGDGIDIESCRNVEISHCNFTTGDDGICIKSGKDKEARKIIGPTENVHIHHCYVGHSHGGFVIGSEMSRGVRNVLVENCTFMDSDIGIRMKSTIGRGGVVENITMRNINMVNILQEAVIMTMNYVHHNINYHEPVVESENPEDIPVFQDMLLENCTCRGARVAVKVAGLPGKAYTIRNVVFKNCAFAAEKEKDLSDCENITFENTDFIMNSR